MRSSLDASEERDGHLKNHCISKSWNVFFIHSFQYGEQKKIRKKLKWVDSSTSLFLAAVADFCTRRRSLTASEAARRVFYTPSHPERDEWRCLPWAAAGSKAVGAIPSTIGIKRALSLSLVSPLETAGGGWAPYTKLLLPDNKIRVGQQVNR
jgi:hypothetical protein